jgi:hypothetical protein
LDFVFLILWKLKLDGISIHVRVKALSPILLIQADKIITLVNALPERFAQVVIRTRDVSESHEVDAGDVNDAYLRGEHGSKNFVFPISDFSSSILG